MNLNLKDDNEDNDKKKIRSYFGGAGLAQDVKAEIIRNILKDYNIDHYVNKYTSKDIVKIKLDPQ